MLLLCGLDRNFPAWAKKCRKLCARNLDSFLPEYLIQLAERYNIHYLSVRQKKTFPCLKFVQQGISQYIE